MSEAEAGPGRIEEDSTARETMDPAAVLRLKEDRRSSSTDVNSDEITLHTICYDGKTLKLPGDMDHMYQVVYRILKNVLFPIVEPLFVGLPPDWHDTTRFHTNSEIALYCKKYNLAAKPYAKNWGGSFNTDTLKDWGRPQCTLQVAMDITTFAYECAVPRPADLNQHYKSFSSETYGETNLEQMGSIIDEIQLGPQDVFVDLGSGIGQLVCFTAAYARVKKAVGIELSPVPADFAADMSTYFKRVMNHFGKHCGKFELVQGNFLDPNFKKLICEEATVIFINNYAFGPDLMFNITNLLLQDLKHGTRIITTKPFGCNKKEITYRSTNDINSMSETVELKAVESCVSWTANKVAFYLTTMDHTKLIRYYEEEQRKKQEGKNISREGSEIIERDSAKKRKTESNGRDKIKMEHTARKPREESSFASSSTSSGAITATPPATDNNNMPSTSSTAVPAQQPPAVPTGEEDVFFGRTTRKMWKAQTEQSTASHSHQSSKWDAPDTDYTPPTKKSKKHRERENHEPKSNSESVPSSSKKKKDKCPSVPKTPKQPKSSHSKSYSVEPSSAQKHMASDPHHTPSLAKATAPPPPLQEHKPKIEELPEPDRQYGQVDAKSLKTALDTIREAASTSQQVAAIQDAIESVLANPGVSPSQHNGGLPVFPNLQAPVYPPPPQMIPPPPPPPNLIPPTSEVVAEQRHTFMIPPTDPYYNMVVSTYFEFKNHVNQARIGDPVFMSQLRQDIENEKARHNALMEDVNNTSIQIDHYLAKGVYYLKNRLDELGMTSVHDVGELLAGSKQIVNQHKTLTTEHAQLEAMVVLEEQKLRGYGPDAVRLFDEAERKGIHTNFLKVAEGILSNRPTNFTAQPVQSDEVPGTEAKVSPSRRARQKPRQTNSSGGKRGPSVTRKADASNEEIDNEIQEFVQRALQVDHAVKEKERKARISLSTTSERVPRKGEK